MLKSIGVNHINAFRSIEMVDINRFNNAIIEKVNFNAPQLLGALPREPWLPPEVPEVHKHEIPSVCDSLKSQVIKHQLLT